MQQWQARQQCRRVHRLAAVQQVRTAHRKHFLAEQQQALAVLAAAVAETDGHVDLARQVAAQVALGGHQAHVHLRVQLMEALQTRHQPVGGEGEIGGHLQHLMLLPRDHRLQAAVQAVQALLHVTQQQFARFRQHQSAMHAVEQAYRQLLFQAFDLLADGRLAAALLVGRRGEAQQAGGRFEHPQAVQGNLIKHFTHKPCLSKPCLVRGFTAPYAETIMRQGNVA